MADRKDIMDDDALETLFAQAREARPRPSASFMARAEADARAVAAARTRSVAPAARHGWAARTLAALGGWGAVAGLATATIAGLGVGIGWPNGLSDLGGLLAADPLATVEASGYALDDLAPSYFDLALGI